MERITVRMESMENSGVWSGYRFRTPLLSDREFFTRSHRLSDVALAKSEELQKRVNHEGPLRTTKNCNCIKVRIYRM